MILPEKLSSIEKNAFLDARSLKLVVCTSTAPPSLFRGALNDTATVVFVPTGSLNAYKNKTRWQTFNILEGSYNAYNLRLEQAGTLGNEILKAKIQPGSVCYIKIEGTLNDDDLTVIRDMMPRLVYIDLKNTTLTALPDYLFAQKYHLTEVVLPDGLQTIGSRAFSGCSRMTGQLILPATVQTIGEGAFLDCTNLTEVIVTGNKLTEVGANLFRDPNKKLTYQPYK